jgi:hypothetical protein
LNTWVTATEDVVFLAISVRNVGTGLAVMHGWTVDSGLARDRVYPPLEEFTDQIRDIYVAPGDIGFWQGALRDPAAQEFQPVADAVRAGHGLTVYLLYGDYEGGQRVVTQFTLHKEGENWLASAVLHFNVDRPDPR